MKWYRDDTRKQEGGIDYYEGELDGFYGDLLKTPLMVRQEQSRNINEVPDKSAARTTARQNDEVDK